MEGMSGSGPLGAEAQMDWLGQPAQEADVPAVVEEGPGQCSGSGATSGGGCLRGVVRSIGWGEATAAAMVDFFLRSTAHRGIA